MPTTHIPTDASLWRAVKHERRNVQGLQNDQNAGKLHGMQTQPRRDLLVVEKKIGGERELSSQGRLLSMIFSSFKKGPILPFLFATSFWNFFIRV